MDIRVATGELVSSSADGIVVNVFEGTQPLQGDAAAADAALGGAIGQLVGSGVVKGKAGEVNVVHSLGKLPASWVAIAGLGKPTELTSEKVRIMAAESGRALRQKRAGTIAFGLPETAALTPEEAARSITEGALLGLYTFRKHITRENGPGEVKQLTVVVPDAASVPSLEDECRHARILAEATILARDMANEPGNYMTPARMSEVAAEQAAKHGLEVTVLERSQMEEMKMGALLGVSLGSTQPPKLIVLTYKGNSSDQIDAALVGKAITFDSGGISLKPGEGMDEMKGDMAGGAAVIATMGAVARLKPPVNVIAAVPAVENMPGGSAYRPGDILTAMNGRTIEVISTDAEGRLILADALCYVNNLHPKAIIDIATLTGACHVALGDVASGIMGNNEELIKKIVGIGTEAGELIWQLPLFDQYKEQIKSDIADVKNTGGRHGGAITAAQFLAEFVGTTPWAHIDIAGTSTLNKDRGYMVKGNTGVPVRTLVNYITSLAA